MIEVNSKITAESVLRIVEDYLVNNGYDVSELKPATKEVVIGQGINESYSYEFDGIECKLSLKDIK